MPEVFLDSHRDSLVYVKVRNTGRTTLEYRGESQARISLLQETLSDTGWQKDAWSVDGLCEETFEIAPGEAVGLEVEFWDDGHPVRMLGRFSEKGTDRSGVVVLATSDRGD